MKVIVRYIAKKNDDCPVLLKNPQSAIAKTKSKKLSYIFGTHRKIIIDEVSLVYNSVHNS